MNEQPHRRSRALLAWAVVGVAMAVVVVAGIALRDGTTQPDEATLILGAELYNAACVQCHGGPTGGSISDIPPPHNAEGHTWHHADCELERIIFDGLPRRPFVEPDFPQMPAFRGELSEEDVAAILGLIKTWWEDDQREFQAEVTGRVC